MGHHRLDRHREREEEDRLLSSNLQACQKGSVVGVVKFARQSCIVRGIGIVSLWGRTQQAGSLQQEAGPVWAGPYSVQSGFFAAWSRWSRWRQLSLMPRGHQSTLKLEEAVHNGWPPFHSCSGSCGQGGSMGMGVLSVVQRDR